MKYQPGPKWNRTNTPKFCSMRITQIQHSTKVGTRSTTPREDAVELTVVG